MSAFRYSIQTLFVVTAVIGVVVVTLARPSYLLAGALLSVTVLVLGYAMIGAVAGRGTIRAYWTGFALLGWLHLALTLGPWFDDNTGEILLSRVLLDQCGRWLGHDVPDELANMPGVWQNLPYAKDGSILAYVYLAYVVIGQSWFSLLCGCLGGICGRRFGSKRIEDSTT